MHMDGHVEYKGADQADDFAEAPPPAPGSEEEPPDLVPPSQSQAGYSLPEEEVNLPPEPESFMIGQEEEEPPAPELFEEDHTVLSSPDHGQSEPEEELASQEATTFDFDTPPEGPEEEATPPPPAYVSAANPDSPDLSDIAAFGNSEMSGGRDGTLRYNFIIEGIDTADVREAFREAITDRKFVWDIDQILRSVRNGKVQIQNVAPTKGYILVTRLRGLPLKIRWEQYAIQQT